MTLALDSNVLVHWALETAPAHEAIRRTISGEVRAAGGSIAAVPQILFEFVHVVTDRRRIERPMSMAQALAWAMRLWDAPETQRIRPGPVVVRRTFELLARHRLGRKRILDTAFAATLEEAGVRRVLTLNPADFRIFPFLEALVPDGA